MSDEDDDDWGEDDDPPPLPELEGVMTNEDKTYPLPEVLDGQEWEIMVGIPAKTNAKAHWMAVPLSMDPHDAVVRTHEMAHIKWSPREASAIPKDVNPIILGAVEDARVNLMATGAKVDLSAGFDPGIVLARIAHLIRTKDEENLLLATIGFAGTGSYALARGAAMRDGGLQTDYRRVLGMFEVSHVPAFQRGAYFLHCIDVAKWLESELKRVVKNRECRRQKQESEAQSQGLRRPGVATKAMEDFEKQLQQQKSSPSAAIGRLEGTRAKFTYEPDGMPRPRKWDSDDDWVEWGDMEIQEPPLKNKLPGRMGRKTRPSDMGAALAYPQRLYTDAKVFGRRLPSLGGAVLVDGSGSMSLTPAQVFAILKAAPGCTVAIYGAPDMESGILRVLARRGMYVDKGWVQSPGGHNVIDLPALMWLAKQEEPRIWVSDGCVTARGERMTSANTLECAVFIVRNRILRLPHAGEAIEHLERIQKRRLGYLAA